MYDKRGEKKWNHSYSTFISMTQFAFIPPKMHRMQTKPAQALQPYTVLGETRNSVSFSLNSVYTWRVQWLLLTTAKQAVAENCITEMIQMNIHTVGAKSPTGKALTSHMRTDSSSKPLFEILAVSCWAFKCYTPLKTVCKTVHHSPSPVTVLNDPTLTVTLHKCWSEILVHKTSV